MEICSYEIKVKGVVQGVGFRPFIYSIAKSLYLNGTVKNACGSVAIEIEGTLEAVNTFIELIKKDAPPLSCIKGIDIKRGKHKGYADFTVERSDENFEQDIYISPDVAICKECEKELFDENNRRYLYPFINCTNCGPRFTIITGNPYDRVNTTMRGFAMCSDCASEYEEPADRRYHAQPVSCFNCGPRLQLLDRNGDGVDADACTDDDEGGIVKSVAELLEKGNIIALKGLGGYHLVCSALDKLAVLKLRKRKARDDKPFALMVKEHGTALKYCRISEQERTLLESWKRPVVLLEKKSECTLPEEIAPGNPCLGIMLPYTPLHLLLFRYLAIDTLIVTSGNISNEPIFYKDEEAVKGLNGIADFFLINDRDIFIRTDDSVTRVFKGREYIIRRSRGYVPFPITCEAVKKDNSRIPSVLACGGELKNTFCMSKGDEFYISQHIGDLENFETLSSFEEGIEHFKNMFKIKPDMVAYDLHPEYLSTKYAIEQNIKKKLAIQHHHAHIASCMAENGLNGEDIIGVAFDGTGYGEDGHLWGGEFFTGNYSNLNRIGHLEYVKMPGGEMAIKEPWRMAVSYLHMIDGMEINGTKYLTNIEIEKTDIILKMLDKNLNCPLTSSMGRLFDAVSALLGVRSRINYEGQAAIELEYIADRSYDCEYGSYNYEYGSSYKYDLSTNKSCTAFIISTGDIIRGIVEDINNGLPEGIISAKFHETVANIVLEGCKTARNITGIKKVVLSGGVFQNMLLLEKCVSKLERTDFTVYTHSKVPANDGGISLGQAVIAIARKI